MLKEFKAFLMTTNALALAVGVIIGAATGKMVSSVVDDLLMPIISLVLPSGDWQQAKIVLGTKTDAAGKAVENAITYGHLLGSIIDFVIIALVVFLITKSLLKPKPTPPGPPTKVCPECLETIPAAAHRCKACTSVVGG
jgi:large conductance mechanosensitive channel